MNRLQIEAKREMLRRELRPLDRLEFTCLSCTHFDPRSRVCGVFAEVPPPEVVSADINCPSWEHDEIPF